MPVSNHLRTSFDPFNINVNDQARAGVKNGLKKGHVIYRHAQIRNKELSEESISPPLEPSSMSRLNQIANCENADGILPLSAFTRCQSQHQQSFCQPGILRFLLFADHLFSGH